MGKKSTKKRLESLWNRDFYQYAGRCRYCGYEEVWAVNKKNMTYHRFSSNTLDKKPCFIAWCGNCANHAVFDLTAIAPAEKPGTE